MQAFVIDGVFCFCAKWPNYWQSMLCEAIRTNCGECFGHWILKFGIYLQFGACDLGFFALMLPCHFPYRV